jgi:double-stranded uracil-DNA glycosylase
VTLRELLRPSLRAIFVGFNPAPVSVSAGHYYQGRHGRTFWSRLARYGIVPHAPKGAEDDHAFRLGFGFADLIRRPTASIREMNMREQREAVDGLVKRLSVCGRPLVVFTYMGPWKLAHTALEQSGYRVLRMPGPYEAPDSLMRQLQAELAQLRA